MNTTQRWEDYFRHGWEQNNGRSQTHLFARHFLKRVRLPPWARTLLDVGCGMGDAMPEFYARYPNLRLTGCDVSSNSYC